MTLAAAAGGAATYAVIAMLDPVLSGIGGALCLVLVGGVVCFGVALLAGHALGVKEVAATTALFRRLIDRFNPRARS
jgi:hypothetical protein